MEKKIWELCNCTEEEWDNLSPRARYDRRNRRGLIQHSVDYTPALTKKELSKHIVDVILDDDGEVIDIILVNGCSARIHRNNEYYYVYLQNVKKGYLLHRLLYAWFKGDIPRNKVVDHIDNNKHNNKLDNLQLLTRQENVIKDGGYQGKNQYSKK